MAKKSKEVSIGTAEIEEIEDDIRELINLIKIKNEEETEMGEGKKIEDDTAEELTNKLRAIATKLGKSA